MEIVFNQPSEYYLSLSTTEIGVLNKTHTLEGMARFANSAGKVIPRAVTVRRTRLPNRQTCTQYSFPGGSDPIDASSFLFEVSPSAVAGLKKCTTFAQTYPIC